MYVPESPKLTAPIPCKVSAEKLRRIIETCHKALRKKTRARDRSTRHANWTSTSNCQWEPWHRSQISSLLWREILSRSLLNAYLVTSAVCGVRPSGTSCTEVKPVSMCNQCEGQTLNQRQGPRHSSAEGGLATLDLRLEDGAAVVLASGSMAALLLLWQWQLQLALAGLKDLWCKLLEFWALLEATSFAAGQAVNVTGAIAHAATARQMASTLQRTSGEGLMCKIWISVVVLVSWLWKVKNFCVSGWTPMQPLPWCHV